MDRSPPEKRGKGGLDRHRWRLYQTAFSGSCPETLGGCRCRPFAKGCSPSRLAAQVEAGKASRPRPTAQVWQEQDQPGQASGTETRLADCRVHAVRRNSYKTFLATYRPIGGVVRVVLVKEDHGWFAFFCTQPEAGAVEILEAFADRATSEQDFHDVKEVWGSGQQQVRNIWTNVAVYNLNLWMHTLVELWAWDQSHAQLCDRSDSPWDDANRRPSHANRRKALRQQTMQNELSILKAA